MIPCEHPDTYYDERPWPTGEAIEICRLCGESRAHWEQGVSPWILIDDLELAREEVQAGLDVLEQKANARTDTET